MTWLTILAAVALLLLYQMAQRLERIEAAVNRIPEPPEPEDKEIDDFMEGLEPPETDAPDSWVHPFAFSLDDFALQRAYLEELTRRALADLRAEPKPPDSDVITNEVQVARRYLAAMIQANQLVRRGDVLATVARAEVVAPHVAGPFGSSPAADVLYRFAMNSHDRVRRDREGLIRRFREQGILFVDVHSTTAPPS